MRRSLLFGAGGYSPKIQSDASPGEISPVPMISKRHQMFAGLVSRNFAAPIRQILAGMAAHAIGAPIARVLTQPGPEAEWLLSGDRERMRTFAGFRSNGVVRPNYGAQALISSSRNQS